MNVNDLTFGQLKEIGALLNPVSNDEVMIDKKWVGEKVMIFLSFGFIFVGNLYTDNDKYRLENAWNCRRQTEGQGWAHIAREGKQICTIDDYQDEPIYFYRDKILFIRKVDAKKWD